MQPQGESRTLRRGKRVLCKLPCRSCLIRFDHDSSSHHAPITRFQACCRLGSLEAKDKGGFVGWVFGFGKVVEIACRSGRQTKELSLVVGADKLGDVVFEERAI